jgi:hypothetical protein
MVVEKVVVQDAEKEKGEIARIRLIYRYML